MKAKENNAAVAHQIHKSQSVQRVSSQRCTDVTHVATFHFPKRRVSTKRDRFYLAGMPHNMDVKVLLCLRDICITLKSNG